jgi:Protein of unknown function (DUF3119)
MSSLSSAPAQPETIILNPSYRLPVGLAIMALSLSWLSWWVAVPILLFAIFLGIQAATLRLHFTASALELYRGQTQIRFFPYAGWYHWEIYWPAVPILFYFREVNSIHFLPMLFDPRALAQSLSVRCPRQQDQATPSGL